MLEHRTILFDRCGEVAAQVKVAPEMEVEALDRLLAAVFASRSWRTGHAASRLFRLLFRSASPTAPQRWERLRTEIQARTRRS